MGEGGLEPPRPYEHWHLKPARLPFRHSPEWMLHASKTSATTHPLPSICLGTDGSGIVLMMKVTDWETRELESASRERLLVEIGTLQNTIEMKQVAALEAQVLRLQQELLAARDFAIGAAARAGETNIQAVQLVEKQVLDLRRELLAARDFAIGAASRAGEAQAQVTAQAGQLAAAQARVAFLSKYINRMRNSTTWKIGRVIMLPVRVVNKISGKSA